MESPQKAYTIGYSPKRKGGAISEAKAPDAKHAVKLVRDLQASDEDIRYIRAPWGGEIGIRELEMYAEEPLLGS